MLNSTNIYVRFMGPLSADGICGFANTPRYIDTGPTELAIRSATSVSVARFANARMDIRAVGSVATDRGLTANEHFDFLMLCEF